MSDVTSLTQLSLILGYVVPGLIIIFIRAQFLTGRIASPKDSILSYFTLSVIYLAIVQAITALVTGKQAPLFQQTPYWLPIMLVGAAAFGVLIGLNAGFGISRWFLGKIGINVPHAIETAWDFRFHRLPECLVTITLKDGSKVYGWWGEERWLASSEQRYAVDKWIPCRLFPWIAVAGVTQGGRSPTGVMPTTAATFMLPLPPAVR